ncbi:hypothetical protein WJU16_25150 [Chitinophaga pollutisoli]|uniref:Uncharacterized protein n=1 Tax=Chitinophaga pollutisoli TaxID=3133966 RepID=A0ABZ2YQY5_9BACT
MKLYRIVHKSIANLLELDSLTGCDHHSKLPFIRAYDSIAMAVLEHPVGGYLADLPDKFRILEYMLPDGSVEIVKELRYNLYASPREGSPKFGDWAWRFLIKEAALVAQIPSLKWKWGSIYIINPKHPYFDKAGIKEVKPIQTP